MIIKSKIFILILLACLSIRNRCVWHPENNAGKAAILAGFAVGSYGLWQILKNYAEGLEFACYWGNLNKVKLLVFFGTNINRMNAPRSQTPLHFAAENGQTEVVKFLINSGALIDPKDTSEYTPLFLACSNGHTDVVKLLIDAGADVNARTKYFDFDTNMSPLLIAAKKGHSEIAQLLINANAEMNAMNKAGDNPLLIAAYHGHFEIVQMLVSAGAIIDKNDHGTALHWVCYGVDDNYLLGAQIKVGGAKEKANRLAIAELLIKEGALVDEPDNDGCTPLHLAAKNNHRELVVLLLTTQPQHPKPEALMYTRSKNPLDNNNPWDLKSLALIALLNNLQLYSENDYNYLLESCLTEQNQDIAAYVPLQNNNIRKILAKKFPQKLFQLYLEKQFSYMKQLSAITNHKGEKAIDLFYAQKFDDLSEDIKQATRDKVKNTFFSLS